MTVTQSTDFAQAGTYSAKGVASGGLASHYIAQLSIPAGVSARIKYWVYIPTSWTGARVLAIDISDGGWSAGEVTTRDTWVEVDVTRPAKSTAWVAGIGQSIQENVDGLAFYIDNLSITFSADQDRSVNANGLFANGTVTKTAVATGAELVAYSGFSASNYLSQPYNSDLDFGTGDFCVMGWVKNGVEVLVSRSEPSFSGADWDVRISNTNNLQFVVNTSAILTGSMDVTTTSWQHVCVVRSSGVVYLYVNSALDASTSNSTDLTNTSAVLGVGARVIATPDKPFTGSLALFRIGATAPTAEQIRKIYNDEKWMFAEGAQVTLNGSSDAVTALAHDKVTDLLHVGTSGGMSVFDGLVRVSEDATAVTTSISANDGRIVRQ